MRCQISLKECVYQIVQWFVTYTHIYIIQCMHTYQYCMIISPSYMHGWHIDMSGVKT